MYMTSISLVVMALGSTISPAAPSAATPHGWQLTALSDRPLAWATPKGWRLIHALPATGALPSSLTFEGKRSDGAAGWLHVQATVSDRSPPAEILARQPHALTRVTTRGGWTCGEEAASGAEVVCVNAGDLVTTIIEVGDESERAIFDMGGIEAVRQAAPLFKGVWPAGLPQPNADGQLPAIEWSASSAPAGDVAWTAPLGWRAVEANAASPVSTLSFRASAGAGLFSITALPGPRGLSADQIPVAETGLIQFLLPGATTTRAAGWTCGEGRETASGLPAIICHQIGPDGALSVSVRAEPAVFAALGGIPAVRAAAAQLKGFGL
jgi:hypothetical protein